MVPLLSVNVMKESGDKYVFITDQVQITAMKPKSMKHDFTSD